MKKQIFKWGIRIGLLLGIFVMLVIVMVLNPSVLYAHKTIVGKHQVFHNAALPSHFTEHVKHIDSSLKNSELYQADFALDFCLNDGSWYPNMVEMLMGPAFAAGFYNKVVVMGDIPSTSSVVVRNKEEWDLESLLAHEAIHCYQFNRFGLWNSNPLANYPHWKWEGYAEYMARIHTTNSSLTELMQLKIISETENPDDWAIRFVQTNTICPKNYYDAWLLTRFCMEVKGMTYVELLNDQHSEEELTAELNDWFVHQ